MRGTRPKRRFATLIIRKRYFGGLAADREFSGFCSQERTTDCYAGIL